MVSKCLMVLLVVALVTKTLAAPSPVPAPTPAPAPAAEPMLGYLMWSTGMAHGLASGLGLYGLMDILTDDDNNQPLMFVMPQGGQPVSVALRRNGNRNNQYQIVQLPGNMASTVQTLS